MLLGALALLAAASMYAISSALVKLEAPRLDIFAHNAYRLTVGSTAMLLLFLAIGDPTALGRVPLNALAALVAMVLCGLVIGDTLNYRAMLLIGMSRAFPIANSYPLLTLAVAALWLEEQIGWREVAGGLITLIGVTLVALPTRAEPERPLDRRTNIIGVLLAVTAAILWAGANSFAKLALTAMEPATANAIRLPLAAVLAWLLLVRRTALPIPWRLPRRTVAAVCATGLLATTIAGLLTLYGVQQIGAGRASVLGSTAPLFGVPLSLLILKERLPVRVVIGTLLSVIGIGLIVTRQLG